MEGNISELHSQWSPSRGKEESALDELLLGELATEAHGLPNGAHGLPNGWVRETARGGADRCLSTTSIFAMQVCTTAVVDTDDHTHVETSVAGSPEEALEWGKRVIRDTFGRTPVSNYEEENIAERGEGEFYVKSKNGLFTVSCESHEFSELEF
ncbi:hypothetical protein GGP50_002595 [Salinibacter ruber]|uniref:hypothetical protein n=1 Tax=Salinibacter ruber TaxID=146919 RepID=UPI00216A5BC0|nr:hypothetical protein [Salinibacter ruber]MCS4194369.1 hypothetical protein [Salinibacter ruber]